MAEDPRKSLDEDMAYLSNADRSRTVRGAIERAKHTMAERDQAGDNPASPPPPSESSASAGQPMHFSDRWLFILLAWSAMPTAAVVAGVVACFQGYPHWGAGLVLSGLLGMTVVTLHLIEKKPRSLPKPSLAVGAIAVVTWAFLGCEAWVQFRPAVRMPTADEIAAAVVKVLPQPPTANHAQDALALGPGQTTIGNLTIPIADRILEQPTIEWDGKGPIIFHARVDHSIEKMPIYLDWGNAGWPNENYVINSGMMGNPRVEIAFIERLAVGQMLRATIGEVTPVGGQQQVLQWGEAHYNNTKTGIFNAATMARVVIVRKDGKEEQYPFLIIPKPLGTPPIIVSPGLLEGMIIR